MTIKKTLGGALSFVLIFQALCLQAAVESLRTPSIEPAIYAPTMLALPSLATRERAELPTEIILQSGLPQVAPAEDSSLQVMSANFPLSVIQTENTTTNVTPAVRRPGSRLSEGLPLAAPQRTLEAAFPRPMSQSDSGLRRNDGREQLSKGNKSVANLRTASTIAESQKNVSPDQTDPTTQLSTWSQFWSGKNKIVRTSDFQEPIIASRPHSRLKLLGKATVAPALAALIPTPAFAASIAAHPVTGLLLLKPYLMAATFLALTYGIHRAISKSIDKLSSTFRWKPNTTDTVRFVSSAANSLFGLGAVLHSIGVSGNVLFTAGGIALGLAINKTLANLMRATLFVINRPFDIGDKLRIDKRVYKVVDFQPKYVILKFLENAPGMDAPTDQIPEYSYFTYSQLAGKAVELYRPYTGTESPVSFESLLKLGIGPLFGALKELSRYSYLKAALWALGLVVFGGILPILKAHAHYHFIGIALPYAQSLFALIVSSAASRFFNKFIPLLGKYSKWDVQTTTLFRLVLQLVTYLIGISLAIAALGVSIGTLAVGLGVGTAAFTLASSNILGDIVQAVSLRWQSPFHVGNTIEIAGEKGEVAEIGLFSIVIKTGENHQTLIPYALVDSDEITVYHPISNPNSPKK